MEKSLVLFDIDGTLIDFDLLANKRKARLLNSIRTGKFAKEVSAFFYFWVTPHDKLNTRKLTDTLYDPALIRESVFGDARATLTTLSTRNILGIWSQANTKQQLHKLKSAGLSDFFHKDFVIIAQNKKKALTKLRKQQPDVAIVIVDNQIDMIEDLTHAKVQALLLNRKDNAPVFPRIITSLRQLSNHI